MAVILPVGGFQSGGLEGRKRLFTFDFQDEKVKVWMTRGAGNDTKWYVLGENGYWGIISLKEITFKHCGTSFEDVKVELLHNHLPEDAAQTDFTYMQPSRLMRHR